MATEAEILAAEFDKLFGGNDQETTVDTFLDTGYAPLNFALSSRYDGGMPVGRIVEMFGPPSSGKTAISTNVMASAQRMGGIAGFSDHERSFDWAQGANLGLDLTPGRFIFKKPRTFEESVTLCLTAAHHVRTKKLIKPEAPIAWVFDSLASMVPQSKLFDKDGKDREVGSYSMHDNTALARATSAAFPAFNQMCEEYGICAIFLNQMRLKPGVCLRGDVMIPFVDGTSMPIRDVVDQRIDKEVWSYNEAEKRFEPKPIVDWFDNGPVASADEWVHVRTTGYGTRNGVKAGTFTRDHKIFVRDGGWTKAEDVRVGDQVLGHAKRVINGTLRDFVAGVLFGDSSLRKMGENRMTAQFCLQDNNDPDYVAWKVEVLEPALGAFAKVPVTWPGGEGVRYDSPFSHELAGWLPYHRDPLALLKAFGLSPLALALWVMDDGYLSEDRRYMLSLKRIKDADMLDAIADELYYAHGLRCRVRHREGLFVFDADSSRKISETIAPLVPRCMERKVMEADRHAVGSEPVTVSWREEIGEVWETVTSVGPAGRTMSDRSRRNRFDITVEDNHNFLAGSAHGGFLVHNCYGDPTTTPGGESPKFYASIRVQLGAKRISKGSGEDKEVLGQVIGAKVIKNKVARPFLTANWRFLFQDDGTGKFDVIGSLVEFMIENKLLEAAGARVKWTDGKSYYKAQLVERIEKEGLLPELLAMLPTHHEPVVTLPEEDDDLKAA